MKSSHSIAVLCIIAALSALSVYALTPAPVHEPERRQVQPERPMLNRSVRIAVFGDIRPACSGEDGADGVYNAPIITAVLKGIADAAPDLIIATGDYLCAYPSESEKARTQIAEYKRILKAAMPDREMRARIRYSQGNHELGHKDLIRVALGDDPSWVAEYGNLRIVSLPSDYAYDAGAEKAAEQALTEPSAAVTILVRHEPPGSHGTRHDKEFKALAQRVQPTLMLHGHEHYYRRLPGRALIVGNGGASYYEGFPGYVIIDAQPAQGGAVLKMRAINALTGLQEDSAVYSPPDMTER